MAEVQKQVEERQKKVNDTVSGVISLMKEKTLSVQDAVIVVKMLDKKINEAMMPKPLSDFI